jgi:single-strand DNA-binding protein
MPKGLNKIMVIGYLGKDPELRYTSSGVAVCSFSVAVTETWKDADGNKKEATEWFLCEAWNKLAEICGEWIKTGSRVYVEGRMKTDKWQDKNHSDVTHYRQKIRVDSILFLDKATDSSSQVDSHEEKPQGKPPSEKPGKPGGHFDDDLPF